MELIPPLYVVPTNFILGVFVLLKNIESRINRLFSAIAISLGLWTAAVFFAASSSSPELSLLWLKASHLLGAYLTVFFLLFAWIYPKEKNENPLFHVGLLFLPALFFTITIPLDQLIKTVIILPSGAKEVLQGPLYPLYSIYFLFYFGAAFLILLKKHFRSKGREKIGIAYIFLGFFSTALFAIAFDVVLPVLGVDKFWAFGPYSTVFLIGFMAYAIVKNRLMDISVAISRFVAEILAIIFHGIIYLALVWLYRAYLSSNIDLLFIVWTVVYGIIVGQTHQGIRTFFQTTSEKLFLRGKYDYYKALSDASARVGEKLSLAKILKVLYDTFHEVVEISNPRIFLPEYFTEADKTSAYYVVYDKESFAPQPDGQKVELNDPLVKALIAGRKLLHDKKDLGADLVIPCLLEDRLIAFFALGPKLSEEAYTNEDIRLLKILANQVAMALDHTRSYEKIRTELEETEKQLNRSQRLAAIGTLTAGVTHEIRNPLTVIRSETERLTNQPRDLDYLKQYQALLLKHIDRIAGIVDRMLGLAKEKQHCETEVFLNEIIETTLQCFAFGRLKVVRDLRPVPPIKGDPDEIQEVFVNLIQNALEAMQEDGTLTLKTYRDDGHVAVEVSDTGKGIPAEIREKIFDPFFSTRHDGVGLGLSIVYRIVREHGGDIKVESEIGQGTTLKLIF
ncbi:MAG: ATP-binding protein [Candidatus Margulisiibacteriota bacterium]